MNKEISTTIEEIRISVNHSYNGIESKNPDEINKFVTELIPLIDKFNKQVKHFENKSDEYCLSFSEDLSNLYDYLFIQGTLIRFVDTSGRELRKIFNKLSGENENISNILKKFEKGELQSDDYDELIKEIPKGAITLNEAHAVLGKLIAIKHNGNPIEVRNLKKSVKEDPLKDFISIYPTHEKENGPETENMKTEPFYVLKESVILKLFEEYGACFPGENKKGVWKQRWIDDKIQLSKINIDEFKEGNNKHLLLTILHEAYPLLKATKKEDYIKKRWGLNSYSSDISVYLNNTRFRNANFPDQRKYSEHPEKGKIIEILKSE